MYEKLDELAKQGIAALADEGVDPGQCRLQPSLDCRYTGQSYTLNIPWLHLRQAQDDFHGLHQSRYGHSMDIPVELVNLRMAVTGPAPNLVLEAPEHTPRNPAEEDEGGVKHYQRASLVPGEVIEGPAIISERVATTWLAEGWHCRVEKTGNLLLGYRF